MNTDDVLKLMSAFDESTLSELRYRIGEDSIVLRRGHEVPTSDVSLSQRSAALAPDDEEPAGPSSAEEGLERIVSPIVGTFYRSPSPDAPPFVEEGTVVTGGDAICILEAMKVMNELQAEFDLEVVTILVENGSMVEYGTPLFEVRRK